ncbi:EAL domain-containing protein [Paenibacillus sp. PR3]|uniref:EAL domain-containing protein n=1 Tax=Paenibacillus terricola TaxID=2763503 RepID=A0ABR8MZ93_9BACL|nr:bifunctional diguanylate cyclase/phosphodiesterase [Paenibacillus terricola]MBD3921252.1 EAL domain-containing protein [Paenibacillus terricola]
MVMLHGTYNIGIVLLSFLIATLSSFSALNMIGRVWRSRGRSRWGWIASGAIVMGSGIWSMHFVGMLAFHLNLPITFDAEPTALSMLASIFASFIAFYITQREQIRLGRIAIGGLVMGAGISAMHYIGMAAVSIPGVTMNYDPFYWTLSVLVAIAVSYAALFIMNRFRSGLQGLFLSKMVAAVLMGLAVCGMHYTGMASVTFWCSVPSIADAAEDNNIYLLGIVTLSIATLLLVSWGAMFIDRAFLERMAYKDQLTGLPNRYELSRRFESFLSQSSRGAILFIDIDQFKSINDTLGHDIGDLLVLDASRRFEALANKQLMVFRIGGDEFLLIAEGADQTQAQRLAQRLLSRINQPFYIEGNELFVSCSIGIALYPEHGSDRSSLMRSADAAMYEAKAAGKNRSELFNPDIQERLLRRMQLENDLRKAMEYGGQFIVHYQPKWDTRLGRPIGFEALVRWNHPELGIVAPSEFIPIAEETGMIVGLSRFVLRQACRDCIGWERSGLGMYTVSVNTSVRLFDSQILFEMVKECLQESRLPSDRLELEITESIVIHDMNEVIRQLNQLREIGVKASMDDFGAGYSSLGSLDLIPIDTVKIDRLFISQSHIPARRAIIRTIITLAQQLNLEIVAEGVEEEEQVELLTEAGCFIIQGYYFGRPMSAPQIVAYLKELGCAELEVAAGADYDIDIGGKWSI